MSEETQAAALVADVEVGFDGRDSMSLAEFTNKRFPAVSADTAPADSQTPEANANEDSPESASDTGTDNDSQEPKKAKKRNGEERKAQLRADIEREWEKPEPDTRFITQAEHTINNIEQGQKRKTESAPVAQPEAPRAQPQPATRTKPTAYDTNPDGTPKYADWDAYNEDFVDWKAEQKLAEYKREQAQQEERKAFESQISEVRARYDDADAVISQTIKALNEANLPEEVHKALGTSPLCYDLCYEVGSDPEDLKKFISLARTNPRAAIRQVLVDEERLQLQRSAPRDEKGKFASREAPEPKKTSAPKPPTPVGGGSSRAFDVSDESLSADEWARKRTQQLEKRRG